MGRQIFVQLLFAWLIGVSALNHVTAKVQAIQSDDFKLRTLQAKASMKVHAEHAMPSWVKEKKARKSPSGPNPVGNRSPPSKDSEP